jgi:hypothetical protein
LETTWTTVAGSQVFTAASMANAPTGGSAPTAAQNAAATWNALTTGGWVPGSMGLLFTTNLNATITSRAALSDVQAIKIIVH